MVSFTEFVTAEISNDGYVRPMSILRQCRNVLRQESSRSMVMGRPTNLIEIILCLLGTYTPSSSLIDLINTVCLMEALLLPHHVWTLEIVEVELVADNPSHSISYCC